MSSVMRYVASASTSTMATSLVAQTSAVLTMRVFSGSADETISTILWKDESPAVFSATISNTPIWLMVPLYTGSPTDLSSGMDSPVTTDWSMEVSPDTTFPSTGTDSPGRTFSTCPGTISSTGTSRSPSESTILPVRGDKSARASMPFPAFIAE